MRLQRLLKNFLTSLAKDERGQSTTEYILILAVVVMIAMRFKGLLNSRLETMMGKLGSSLDSAVSDQ